MTTGWWRCVECSKMQVFLCKRDMQKNHYLGLFGANSPIKIKHATAPCMTPHPLWRLTRYDASPVMTPLVFPLLIGLFCGKLPIKIKCSSLSAKEPLLSGLFYKYVAHDVSFLALGFFLSERKRRACSLVAVCCRKGAGERGRHTYSLACLS